MSATQAVTGLILSGGGARAAYQVGVLAAIAELLPEGAANPFPVIVGTSAGAINAVSLASGAMNFASAVEHLTAFWQAFESRRVLRSDKINFSGINQAIEAQQLRAVAVTAFGYSSGQAVTFYEGKGAIDGWLRHRRIGMPTPLTIEHLLASSAIPLLFAPVKIGEEYFGDGAVRQSAPISPALHLGANRVLVVGVSGNPRGPDAQDSQLRQFSAQQPTLAQIGGHMLNSTFIDSLESDIELLERLNHFSRVLPRQTDHLGLSPVEVLVIAPSQPIDEIAARHRHELPAALRLFLRGPGATKTSGAGVLSYLLFEAGYCRELIALGRMDALAKRKQLCTFLRI